MNIKALYFFINISFFNSTFYSLFLATIKSYFIVVPAMKLWAASLSHSIVRHG